jgi:hypothetical protein
MSHYSLGLPAESRPKHVLCGYVSNAKRKLDHEALYCCYSESLNTTYYLLLFVFMKQVISVTVTAPEIFSHWILKQQLCRSSYYDSSCFEFISILLTCRKLKKINTSLHPTAEERRRFEKYIDLLRHEVHPSNIYLKVQFVLHQRNSFRL